MTDCWYILGAGAIGHLLAWKLHQAGVETCLIYRAGQLAEHPKRIQPADGLAEQPIDCQRTAVDQLTPGQIKQLILTTKANQASQALTDIRPALADGALVILAHNGMGVYEEVQAQFPELNLALAVTTEGANWQNEQTLNYAGVGSTRLGQPNQTAMPDWAAPLTRGDTHISWEADIERALWEKLVINCAINPLTAIHQCKNGELGRNPKLREQVKTLCKELEAVTRARGDNELANTIEDKVFAVIEATAENESSMMRDIKDGRASEVNYISGFFLESAEQRGTLCSENLKILETIRALQKTPRE